MVGELTIPARFNGPPTSGNGGYVCGLMGSRLPGPAVTTLRIPPPLERPLQVVPRGDGLQLLDGDALVAEAEPATVEVEVPAPVSLDEASAAVAGYRGFTEHAFPSCFVCGPERGEGDGLRLFPGPVGSRGVAATPWTPEASLGEDGVVRPEIVWAALDCPSYFGGPVGRLAVLGRLAVEIRGQVHVGQPHVVMGWGVSSEGRKHLAGAAISDASGNVLAVSRAIWIELGG